MAVAAKKLVNRDVYEVEYDGAENRPGGIVATFTNSENGDQSTYKGLDDGKFVTTVAAGYSGDADVEIADTDGNTVDEGAVSFG